MAKAKEKKPIILGRRRALNRARRVRALRREGFTEGEIRVFKDRRLSTPGMKKLLRARRNELKGLTEAEKREWAAQNEEARDEQHAIDDLRKVSP